MFISFKLIFIDWYITSLKSISNYSDEVEFHVILIM